LSFRRVRQVSDRSASRGRRATRFDAGRQLGVCCWSLRCRGPAAGKLKRRTWIGRVGPGLSAAQTVSGQGSERPGSPGGIRGKRRIERIAVPACALRDDRCVLRLRLGPVVATDLRLKSFAPSLGRIGSGRTLRPVAKSELDVLLELL